MANYSDNEPSPNLITLEFVLMVYIPMWFVIKGNPYVRMAARYLYKTAKLTKE